MCFTRKLTQVSGVIPALLGILTFSLISPSYAKPDPKVLAAVNSCEPKARDLLQQLVQIDSGTGDVAGVAAVGAILKVELENLGAKVESAPATVPGVADNLVATLTGRGKGRILLIAHMDTVFPKGTVAQRPYKVVGDHGIVQVPVTTRRESSAPSVRYASCISLNFATTPGSLCYLTRTRKPAPSARAT